MLWKYVVIFFLAFVGISLIVLISYYSIAYIRSLIKTKVPYIPTLKVYMKYLKKLDLEKGKKVIDLGCGDGKILRFFEKEYGVEGTGYEINGFAVLYGKILNKIKKSKIKIVKQDFQKADLKNFDYIYIYLFPEIMEKYEDWIFSNKKSNAIIISTAFKFKKHKPFKSIDNKVFLYK